MESYVEVSMLHNTATILLSFLMASYACVQPLPIRKMLVYALAPSTPAVLFFPGSWLFLVLEEVVFFWQFRFCAKSWMMMQESAYFGT